MKLSFSVSNKVKWEISSNFKIVLRGRIFFNSIISLYILQEEGRKFEEEEQGLAPV